jgi:hypothetical protein
VFNKEDIAKYQSIAPSEDLKKRVMTTYEQGKETKKHNTLYKQLSLIAACIVLVIVGAVFVRTEPAEVKLYANGEMVAENSVVLDEYGVGLASERSVSEDVVIINLETTAFLKSEIEVSQGEISVFDKKTGEALSSGETCSVNGQVSIQWVVEKEKVDKAEMKISNAFNEEIFEIEYEDETEQKIIKKK